MHWCLFCIVRYKQCALPHLHRLLGVLEGCDSFLQCGECHCRCRCVLQLWLQAFDLPAQLVKADVDACSCRTLVTAIKGLTGI